MNGAGGGRAARARPVAGLIVVGAVWGLGQPLMRIATETGQPPLGLVLVQQLVMVLVLAPVLVMRPAPRAPAPLPRGSRLGLYVWVAVLGAVVPGWTAFIAAAELPAGVRAIIIASVPLFTLPIALALGSERPDLRRAVGILAGMTAIVLIAQPGAGLPPGATLALVAIALVAPLCYGIEANYLARQGGRAPDPVALLFGAGVMGVALTLPLCLLSGQMPRWPEGFGRVEAAILGTGALHALAYTGYVWLIGRAGSVFAAQVAYLVTGFGVLWSMLLLGERYGPAVWVAFVLMLGGIALVQPRPRRDSA